MTQVVQPESLEELDSKVAKAFILKAAQQGALKRSLLYVIIMCYQLSSYAVNIALMSPYSYSYANTHSYIFSTLQCHLSSQEHVSYLF